MYQDRVEAGKVLAQLLKKFSDEPVLLLAIPRGGVPIAFVISEELNFELDLILTKKIGHPLHPEYAIGAVSPEDSFVIPHPGVDENYIKLEIEAIHKKLDKMYHKFMGSKKPTIPENKVQIVIDDGIATGNTLKATIKMLHKHKPQKIVIGVPVASPGAIRLLTPLVDEIICPLIPRRFRAVGEFYQNFTQVSDDEVIHLLNILRKEQLINEKE